MKDFSDDKIENEKSDPHESSSLKFINVPLVLLAMFWGFGITYLGLRTPDTKFNPGDSRTEIIEKKDEDVTKVDPKIIMVSLKDRINRGQKIYNNNCKVCHQADGNGVAESFPPLSGSEWVNGSGNRMIGIVLHGVEGEITVKGEVYDGVMPTFNEVIEYDEIADVITYVRQAFGNKAEPVDVDMVKKVLEATKDREDPWEGGEAINKHNWD